MASHGPDLPTWHLAFFLDMRTVPEPTPVPRLWWGLRNRQLQVRALNCEGNSHHNEEGNDDAGQPTQRKLGIRAMSWIKIANPRLNRVSASYTASEKPTAVCLIQIVPKTKTQLSSKTKKIVVTAPADDLRRSLLKYLSTRSFLR